MYWIVYLIAVPTLYCGGIVAIQFFRRRLSHNSLHAYSTVPVLWVVIWRYLVEAHPRVSLKEREGMNTRISYFPFLSLKYLELYSSNSKTTVTHNNFWHCRVWFYAFVRQHFAKQLYIKVRCNWCIIPSNWIWCC